MLVLTINTDFQEINAENSFSPFRPDFFYLTSITVFLEILNKKKIYKKLKKKALKMTSQLVIFRAFFFVPLYPKSEKKIP